MSCDCITWSGLLEFFCVMATLIGSYTIGSWIYRLYNKLKSLVKK